MLMMNKLYCVSYIDNIFQDIIDTHASYKTGY